MKLRNRRRADRAGLVRTARVDRRVEDVLARVRPGEIAVVDVVDLDRTTAESLVSAGVSAVVNAAPSCSGRFAVRGPRTLLDAGILLVDDVGGDVFSRVRDGDTIRLDGAVLYAAGERVAEGVLQSDESVEQSNEAAHEGMQARLGSLVADASRRLAEDSGRLVEGDGFPPLSTTLRDRVVVVVTAGSSTEELREARGLVRRRRAVVVAVGAGAERALAARLRPDLTVVGRSGVSEQVLARAREVLVLDGADVTAPVPAGIPRASASSLGSVEDTAVLLAHTRGAAFVVTCGLDESLGGVLDRSAAAGSMPLLGRVRGGGRHVSADGLRALREKRRSLVPTAAVTLAALAGLTLGALAGVGPLHSLVEDATGSTGTAAVRAEQDLAAASEFRAALAPAVVGGTLTDHTVTVVTLPGAPATGDLLDLLGAAGADLNDVLALDADYLAPARARVLRDLAVQVAPAPGKAAAQALPAGSSAQATVDAALAASLATRSAPAVGRTDTARTTLLDGLSKIGALTPPARELRGADLVVLVVPTDARRGGQDAAAVAERGAALAAAFARAGRAVVVVTDGERGGASSGVVGALRTATGSTSAAAAASVSTVDTSDVQGAITTVLALRSRLSGRPAGHYGTASDAAVLVPGAPSGTSSQP